MYRTANLNFWFGLKSRVWKSYIWIIIKINNSVHTNLIYRNVHLKLNITNPDFRREGMLRIIFAQNVGNIFFWDGNQKQNPKIFFRKILLFFLPSKLSRPKNETYFQIFQISDLKKTYLILRFRKINIWYFEKSDFIGFSKLLFVSILTLDFNK